MRPIARALCLTLAVSLALCVPTRTAAAQGDDALSRELAGIAEEQDLLRRQIQRLRQTMEVLLPRLESEGRVHALDLLLLLL